jgi:hypothetical protein
MWLKLIIPFTSHVKKWNEVASVHGNWTMNLLALVPHIGLWASSKMLRHPYGGQKFFQTATSFKPSVMFSLAYFLDLFCASNQKSHNLHDTNVFYMR